MLSGNSWSGAVLYNDAGAFNYPYLYPGTNTPVATATRTNTQCMVGAENTITITTLANGDMQAQIPLTFYGQAGYHLYATANYHTTAAGATVDYHVLRNTDGHDWTDLGAYMVGGGGTFTLSGGPSGGALMLSTGAPSMPISYMVTPSSGFSGTVTLSASGLPAGATALFSTTSGGSGTATLAVPVSTTAVLVYITITAGATATSTPANVVVTAAGAGVTQTSTIALSITAAPGGPYQVTGPTSIPANSAQTFTFVAHLPTGATGFNWVDVRFKQLGLPADGTDQPGASECFLRIFSAPNSNGEIIFYNDAGAFNYPYLYPGTNTPVSTATRTNTQCMVGAENSITITSLANGDMQAQIPLTFYGAASYHLYATANYHTTAAGVTADYHVLKNTDGHDWADMGAYTVGGGGAFTLSGGPSGGALTLSTGGSSMPISYMVTPSTGFSGTVTLSASGLPTGTTALFSATSGGTGSATLPVSVNGSMVTVYMTIAAGATATSTPANVVVTAAGAGVTQTSTIALTVGGGTGLTAPSVTTNPTTGVTVTAGGTAATFNAAASGNPAPTVQWQVSVGGGAFANISGATGVPLSFVATAADNGKSYRAAFTNSQGTAYTTASVLTVNYAPVITTSPAAVTVNAGTGASFTAGASGNPAPTVQWQVSVGGGAFANISGATAVTLSFVTTAADNGKQYRAVFTNAVGTATTVAGLTVVTAPTITTSSLANGWPNTQYSQSLTATGGSGIGYVWTLASGTLPGGLTFSSSGLISGTPNTPGVTSSFSVRVTDSAGGTATAPMTIMIWPGAPSYTISASPLSQTVTVGSTAQVNFTINRINGDTEPVYLSASTGVWSFSPNPVMGSQSTLSVGPLNGLGTNYITAGDANHLVNLTITTAQTSVPSVSCAPSASPVAAGQAVTFTAYGSNGAPPYTYSWVGSAGGVSGTGKTVSLTMPGSAVTETVTVTDSAGNRSSASCGVGVTTPATLTLNVPSKVASGTNATVVVTLPAAVPAGGGTVSLTSSNPAVFPVPQAPIAVSAGQSKVTLSVRAGVTGGTANVTASYAGASRMVGVTVAAGPITDIGEFIACATTDGNTCVLAAGEYTFSSTIALGNGVTISGNGSSPGQTKLIKGSDWVDGPMVQIGDHVNAVPFTGIQIQNLTFCGGYVSGSQLVNDRNHALLRNSACHFERNECIAHRFGLGVELSILPLYELDLVGCEL